MLKVKVLPKTETPVVQGSPEEIREWAISLLGQHIQNSTALPPEAYTTFERLVNAKFLELPVNALAQDLQSIDERLRHIESSTTVLKLRSKHNVPA